MPWWIGRNRSWLEVCRLGRAMHGIHLKRLYHWLLHDICLEIKLRIEMNNLYRKKIYTKLDFFCFHIINITT